MTVGLQTGCGSSQMITVSTPKSEHSGLGRQLCYKTGQLTPFIARHDWMNQIIALYPQVHIWQQVQLLQG
jgi:hypothetical protein